MEAPNNALNRSMQGLWKRNANNTKINLNATVTPAPTTPTTPATAIAIPSIEFQEPPSNLSNSHANANGDAEVPSLESAVNGAVEKPPSTNGKRKTRAPESSGTKRQKTISTNPSSSSSSSSYTPSHDLSSLAGIPLAISKILEYVALPLLHPEIYLHTGIQPPRGVLLYGPPGCGKTMLAEGVAGEVDGWLSRRSEDGKGLGFVKVSAPEIVSGMSGESERAVRDAFSEAKRLAPSILFIDEIDAVTPKRESAQREMERRIVAQFLTCMDELSWDKTDNKPVIVIGATNRPDSLDAALRRAGRFDHEIGLGVPDDEAREQILRVLTSKLNLEPNFDYTALAKATPGYVGADLSSLAAAAGVIAMKRIFGELNEMDNTAMEIDLQVDQPVHFPLSAGPIAQFLNTHPEPLTSLQLQPLTLTTPDFHLALSHTQPSSLREGFTTVPSITWLDIGVSPLPDTPLHLTRSELRMSIVHPIKYPSLFSQVGIDSACGVLLWGPPGCGKTLLAKAVANESRANFISVKGPELLNKYVGESERALRQVFSRARASSPCVVFFDELDALVPRRGGDSSQSESSSRLVNTLLTELDGLDNTRSVSANAVYVIAATNRPDIIDPAMTRPGRLDKLLYVDLPTREERVEIVRTLVRKVPMVRQEGSVEEIFEFVGGEKCDGYSGADLKALVREAGVGALKRTLGMLEGDLDSSTPSVSVSPKDFIDARTKVYPSVSVAQRKRYEALRKKLSGKDRPSVISGSSGLAGMPADGEEGVEGVEGEKRNP